jgi:hypothetical protein
VTLGLGMTPGNGVPAFGSESALVGDTYTMATVTSDMPGGPFAGFQPTFNGTATVNMGTIPVPAAAWLLGSGLLGLVGVARRKAA